MAKGCFGIVGVGVGGIFDGGVRGGIFIFIVVVCRVWGGAWGGKVIDVVGAVMSMVDGVRCHECWNVRGVGSGGIEYWLLSHFHLRSIRNCAPGVVVPFRISGVRKSGVVGGIFVELVGVCLFVVIVVAGVALSVAIAIAVTIAVVIAVAIAVVVVVVAVVSVHHCSVGIRC